MIVKGNVTVNGQAVTEKGVVIDENRDVVRVDGKVCRLPRDHVYVMLNKPKGYLVTMDDQFGRKTVTELLDGVSRRVYPVGRLDYDSEGLLLLTDDGDFAFRLAHPKYRVNKRYTVKVKGKVSEDELDRFTEGITLEDGYVAHGRAKIIRSESAISILQIDLSEGRKREIKQMCKAIGHPVLSLRRVRYGTLSLSRLPRGHWRYLTDNEITKLKARVDLK